MRRGAKANAVRFLRDLSVNLSEKADEVERSDEEPFRWGVAHGHYSRAPKLTLAEREVSEAEAEDVVVGGIWSLFEGHRDATNPTDPATFERVMKRIEALARERCNQPPSKQ